MSNYSEEYLENSENESDLVWYRNLSLMICSVGIITNIINISVFLNPALKEACFKYMLAISITSLLHLNLLNFYPFFIYCSCPTSQTYFAALYTFIVRNYLGPCLSTFRIICEISLSFHFYAVLTNKRRFNWLKSKYWILVTLAISFGYYLPVPLLNQIIEQPTLDNQSFDYFVTLNSVGKTTFGRITKLVCNMVRLLLTLVVLTSINVAMIIKLSDRYGKKNKIREISSTTG